MSRINIQSSRGTIDLRPVMGRVGPQGGQGEVGPQGPGGTGPQGPQGIPGVNAVANDTATAGYISTAGTSATKTALQNRYGTNTGSPPGYLRSFVAAGENNVVTPIADRGKDPVRCHVEGYGCVVHDQSGHAEGTGSIVDGKISHAEGNNCITTANDSHSEGNLSIAGRQWYTDPDTLNLATGSEDAGDGLGVLQYVIIPAVEGDVTSGFPNPLTDNVTTRYGAGTKIDSQGNIYQSIHTPAVWSGSTLVTPNDLQWAMHPVAVLRGTSEGERAFVTIRKAVYTGGATKVYYAGAKAFPTIIGIASSYAPNVWFGGTGQHAEGFFSSTSGRGAHSEGMYTRAWHNAAHAEGQRTRATGQSSHAEGWSSKASGSAAHAEGYNTQASGENAHAEGWTTTASGSYAHAEGNGAVASGTAAHAEGENTVASSLGAHAEGRLTAATGVASHASGFRSVASRSNQDAYAAGYRVTNGDCQVSRIAYNSSRTGAGWHAIVALAALVDDRTYHFESMIVGRQTVGPAGVVGDSFVYKMSGAFTMAGGVMTVLGSIARTLVGRSAGMTGDGLTTGSRVSAYTPAYPPGDLVFRFDGETDKTFYISVYSTVQELG